MDVQFEIDLIFKKQTMASINKPSLLVLGGTGFIGKNIIKKAVTKGWHVASVSLSVPIKKNRIKRVKYYKIDLKLRKNLINPTIM